MARTDRELPARRGGILSEKRIEIANIAQTEVSGRVFVTFDVAMNGYLIATVDAPRLYGRILWSHAAIHGFRDFDPCERRLLEAECDRALSPATPPGRAPSAWHH
jgi:hypothetical protein